MVKRFNFYRTYLDRTKRGKSKKMCDLIKSKKRRLQLTKRNDYEKFTNFSSAILSVRPKTAFRAQKNRFK